MKAHPGEDAEPRTDVARRVAALLADVREGLLVYDDSGVITFASPGAAALIGADPTGWHHTRLEDRLVPDEREATVAAILERLATAGDRPAQLRASLRDAAENVHEVEVTIRDRRADPDVGGVVVVLREITEQTTLQRRLRHVAFHDGLTGLHNRELLLDRVDRGLARARRGDRRVALLLCDLEDFKSVNESLGHAAGDQILCEVADRIRAATREMDTVARLSGDLFGILCEDLDATSDAVAMARRILDVIEHPMPFAGRDLHLSGRIGLAVDPGERTSDELMRDADVALAEAKADTHQRWSLHRTSMTVRAQLRMQLAADLTAAILDDRIAVAYQPVVSLEDGRLVGLEALARWEHPDRGWISPAEFIPVAEQVGVIGALGDRVLDQALGQLATWFGRWPGLDVNVGVNISAKQLREGDAAENVLAMLERHGIPPQHLVLELTESVMLQDADRSLATMCSLREHGVRLAIDDFGTGYSSLAYLRQLPVDVIKIDRSFVTEIGTDRSADDLLRTIIDLADRLGLDVVAEGIETPEQRELLTTFGARFAQGFLLGRPVAAPSIEPLLTDLPRRPTLRT